MFRVHKVTVKVIRPLVSNTCVGSIAVAINIGNAGAIPVGNEDTSLENSYNRKAIGNFYSSEEIQMKVQILYKIKDRNVWVYRHWATQCVNRHHILVQHDLTSRYNTKYHI